MLLLNHICFCWMFENCINDPSGSWGASLLCESPTYQCGIGRTMLYFLDIYSLQSSTGTFQKCYHRFSSSISFLVSSSPRLKKAVVGTKPSASLKKPWCHKSRCQVSKHPSPPVLERHRVPNRPAVERKRPGSAVRTFVTK